MPRRNLSVLLVVLCLGCGRASDAPSRVPVTGEVTYDGQPIAEGKIRFVPQDGSDAPVAMGLIDEGRYTIMHRGGVPLGRHHVVIEAYRPMPGAQPISEELARDFSDLQAGEISKEQFLPARYATEASMLNAEIVATEKPPLVRDFRLAAD